MNKITIHNNIIQRINPNIYGHFIEEIGECIHDGLWVESQKLKHLPTLSKPLEGVRQDLFEAVKPLFGAENPPLLRWPGGCYSDTYHWKDGIGPKENRPVKPNTHWNSGFFRTIKNQYGTAGPRITHQFGTDEFAAFCRMLGASPYINVNYGSGTPEEAANWVEYCNGGDDTEWGKKRAEVSPTPYDVKYWGIGNEIWAKWERGFEKRAKDYAARYLAYARAMRDKDPTIKMIACGLDPATANPLLFARDGNTWNTTLLEIAGEFIDYISLHAYFPMYYHFFKGFLLKFAFKRDSKFSHNEKYFKASMAASQFLEQIICRVWDQIEGVMGKDTSVRLALDEWNAWYCLHQMIKANSCLMDGLFVADTLLLFQKYSNRVSIANVAQMINCVGLIRTDEQGLVETPGYLAFKLLRNFCFSRLLETSVTAGSFYNEKVVSVPVTRTPLISSTATMSEDGKEISVVLINKDYNNSIDVELDFVDFDTQRMRVKQAFQLYHDNPFIENTPDQRTAVSVQPPKEETISANKVRLPKHSLTLVQFQENKERQ